MLIEKLEWGLGKLSRQPDSKYTWCGPRVNHFIGLRKARVGLIGREAPYHVEETGGWHSDFPTHLNWPLNLIHCMASSCLLRRNRQGSHSPSHRTKLGARWAYERAVPPCLWRVSNLSRGRSLGPPRHLNLPFVGLRWGQRSPMPSNFPGNVSCELGSSTSVCVPFLRTCDGWDEGRG